jgi:hypothetical protein
MGVGGRALAVEPAAVVAAAWPFTGWAADEDPWHPPAHHNVTTTTALRKLRDGI